MDALRIRGDLRWGAATSRSWREDYRLLAPLVMLVGLIRLAPGCLYFLTDAARVVLDYWTSPTVWSRGLSGIRVTDLVWMSWPLLFGALIGVRRWPRVLPGLLLVLGVCLMDDLSRLALRFGMSVPIRGFEVAPYAMRDGWSIGWRVVLLALEMVAIWRAWLVWVNWRNDAGRPRTGTSDPEAIAGRLTFFVSGVFASILVGSMGWTVFEDVALRSGSFRKAMASLEIPRRLEIARPEEDYRAVLGMSEIRQASRLVERGEYRFARRAFARGLAILEQVDNQTEGKPLFVPERALGLNNLAWLLATCPDPSLREPERAEVYARKSLELKDDPMTWNTLAVALYRKGDLKESSRVFQHSLKARQGGDPFDWLYLAMIRHDEGKPREASDLFERAETWIKARSVQTEELTRLWREAADHLGVDDRGGVECARSPSVFALENVTN